MNVKEEHWAFGHTYGDDEWYFSCSNEINRLVAGLK